MEMPVARCAVCGKAFKINEGIMSHGKAYCSDKCMKGSVVKEHEEKDAEEVNPTKDNTLNV